MTLKEEYRFYCWLFIGFIFFVPFSFRKLLVTISDAWGKANLLIALAGLVVVLIVIIRHRSLKKEGRLQAIPPGLNISFQVLWAIATVMSVAMLLLWLFLSIIGDAPDIH